jgi:hypothetical protein
MSVDDLLVKILAVALGIVSVLLGVVWKQLNARIAAYEKAQDEVLDQLANVESDMDKRFTQRDEMAKDDRHALRDLIGVIVNEQTTKNLAFARDLGHLMGRDRDRDRDHGDGYGGGGGGRR